MANTGLLAEGFWQPLFSVDFRGCSTLWTTFLFCMVFSNREAKKEGLLILIYNSTHAVFMMAFVQELFPKEGNS